MQADLLGAGAVEIHVLGRGDAGCRLRPLHRTNSSRVQPIMPRKAVVGFSDGPVELPEVESHQARVQHSAQLFLPLAAGCLRSPAIADIPHEHHGAVLVAQAQGDGGSLHLDLGPVQLQELRLQLGDTLLAVVEEVHAVPILLTMVWVHAVNHGGAQQLRRRTRAKEAGRLGVHVGEAGGVLYEDGLGGILHQETEARLALPEGGLGVTAVSHVLEDHHHAVDLAFLIAHCGSGDPYLDAVAVAVTPESLHSGGQFPCPRLLQDIVEARLFLGGKVRRRAAHDIVDGPPEHALCSRIQALDATLQVEREDGVG